jgi:hypothetical protein
MHSLIRVMNFGIDLQVVLVEFDRLFYLMDQVYQFY